MSCCDGLVVDNNYLAVLFNTFTARTLGVGGRVVMLDALGNAGIATNLVLQTRLRFTASPQNMTTAVALSPSWIIEDVDPLNLITVPGTTMTIPTGGDGEYEIEFAYTMASAPSSTVVNNAQIVIAGTGASAKGINRTYKAGNSLLADQHIKIGPLPLAAGDTILCQGIQSSGGTIAMNSAICLVTRVGA